MSDDTLPPSVLHAFHELVSELGEVESEFEPLNHRKEQLRDQIGRMVAEHGQLRVPSATAMITNPGVTRRVSVERLDALISAYRAVGMDQVANNLESIIETAERAGSLRITWSKR